MDKNLPSIAPEALTVANCYIANNMSAEETSLELGVPVHKVQQLLRKKECKLYVQDVLMDLGYNNKFKLHTTLDAVIDQKLKEMKELEMGSSKDIAELLVIKAKIRNDELKLEIELEKAKAPGKSTNIQVNNNYNSLLEKVMKADL